MQGIINSQLQVDILRYLERVGPSPLQPLELVFGRKAQKYLAKLRSAQYAYNITLNEVEFWIPQQYGHFDNRQQELIAWFAARLIESGGEYKGVVGISSAGDEFNIEVKLGYVAISFHDKSQYYARLTDLQEKVLKLCLKPYKGDEKMRELDIEHREHGWGSDGSADTVSYSDNTEYAKAFVRVKKIREEMRITTDPCQLKELQKEYKEQKIILYKNTK